MLPIRTCLCLVLSNEERTKHFVSFPENQYNLSFTFILPMETIINLPAIPAVLALYKCEVSQAELWSLVIRIIHIEREVVRCEEQTKNKIYHFFTSNPRLAWLMLCFDSNAATQNIISTSVASGFPFQVLMGPLGNKNLWALLFHLNCNYFS